MARKWTLQETQFCRPCRGLCGPIPGRGYFGDLHGDGVVPRPSQSLKHSLVPTNLRWYSILLHMSGKRSYPSVLLGKNCGSVKAHSVQRDAEINSGGHEPCQGHPLWGRLPHWGSLEDWHHYASRHALRRVHNICAGSVALDCLYNNV